jgi:transglutaminase-like putative cysteine protease
MILAVRHITTYTYRKPVAFGEHRMILRPRECHDQKVLDLKLEITPEPVNLRWTQDVFGNHVAIARFAGRARTLRFESTARLDHFPTDITGIEIEDFARTYPFTYAAEDRPELAPFLERQCPDGELVQWARTFLCNDESTNTIALLVKLNRAIKETFTHASRHEKGVQDPLLTLKLRRGSCRDLAVLMIEAVRSLGMAARFVSGYLHLPDDNGDDADSDDSGGNMHAWLQVYLPGPGWLDLDPASGIVGNRDLIRVAMVCVPSQAIPLQGTWIGRAADCLKMTIAVKVSAADAPVAGHPARIGSGIAM